MVYKDFFLYLTIKNKKKVWWPIYVLVIAYN